MVRALVGDSTITSRRPPFPDAPFLPRVLLPPPMPLALALAPAPPDLAPLPVALAPVAEVLAATSSTLTSCGPLEATRTPWRLPQPARRRPTARPLCCLCPNGATCRRDPSVPASRLCVCSSLIEPPRRSRTMKSDGRVFLPRAPPAPRHAQGSSPA